MFNPVPKPPPRQKKPRTRLKAKNRNPLPTKISHEVIIRDEWKCQNCNGIYGLSPHHVIRRSEAVGKPWLHDPRNLLTLCLTCHDKTETDQAFYRAIQDKAKQKLGWFAGEEI